jgi:hypothetical protein
LSWSRPFEDPIPTKGKPILTLKDAAEYISRLPKVEHETPHWQAATEALIMAAEGTGPLLHADIGMRRALNHNLPRPERRKRARSYKIVSRD